MKIFREYSFVISGDQFIDNLKLNTRTEIVSETNLEHFFVFFRDNFSITYFKGKWKISIPINQ